VTFGYRINGEGSSPARRGRMTLLIAELIRRYLLHVPEPGTRMVRSYGLYAPTAHAALACCREQLGQGPVEAPAPLDWQTYCQGPDDTHPERCPMCGCRLIGLSIIPYSRVPPPMDRSSEAAA
jgi:hypothetical protein